MKILITGAKGFIGKNIVAELNRFEEFSIMEYDFQSTESELKDYCLNADIIIHLAGVNRPQNEEDFFAVNVTLTQKIVEIIMENNLKTPIVFTSSIQVARDNNYGKSKLECENVLKHYAEISKVPVQVLRLPNVFGKWSRPNYNSVVATFCHNIARDNEIRIDNPDVEVTLIHVDTVVKEVCELLRTITDNEPRLSVKDAFKTYTITLRDLSELLISFKSTRESLWIPNVSDEFVKKLYSTFVTYLPIEKLSYKLTTHKDHRGSFSEILKSKTFGQVSVNISKPNVLKGNHWHTSKHEKFCVISGKGVIRLKSLVEDNIIEVYVDSDEMTIVDIPSGYVHNIECLGQEDMITLMWINEVYQSDTADTHYMEM